MIWGFGIPHTPHFTWQSSTTPHCITLRRHRHHAFILPHIGTMHIARLGARAQSKNQSGSLVRRCEPVGSVQERCSAWRAHQHILRGQYSARRPRIRIGPRHAPAHRRGTYQPRPISGCVGPHQRDRARPRMERGRQPIWFSTSARPNRSRRARQQAVLFPRGRVSHDWVFCEPAARPRPRFGAIRRFVAIQFN